MNMKKATKFPNIFFIYWIIYLTMFTSLSNALEMTTQWHIPRSMKKKTLRQISKPLKLEPEKTIQIFDTQQQTVKTGVEISPFDRMQMDLIRARILARKGHFPAAMKIYKHLVSKYPESLDIRADYVDVLLAYGNDETAIVQIQHLLNHKSYQFRGRQLMAVMYDRNNLPSWTFPIYDQLLNQSPNNNSIWMDYANQRSKIGHWHRALNAYSRILENDPENIYALRSIHNILREQKPALHAQFIQFSGSDGTVRNHQNYSFRYTLTKSLTFRTLFDHIHIKTPENFAAASQDIYQTTMELNLVLSSNIVFTGRLFYYTNSDISIYGAVANRLFSNVDFQISYLGSSAWYDPIQAMGRDGSYKEYQVSLSSPLFEKFRWNSSLAYRQYSLDHIDNYGDRLGIHMDISRRMMDKPDTTLILAIDQGRFSYATDNQDIPMVPEENTYSFSTYIQDQPFGRLSYFLSAGYRWDSQRSLAGFFVNPGLGWKFSSQFQINFSYSYSSESTGVVQGSTETFQMNGMIIF